MKLSDFKAKAVPGLYSYDHFEADNGAFIQVSARLDEYVLQTQEGEQYTFTNIQCLKEALKEI